MSSDSALFTKTKNFWLFDLNVRVNEDANLPYSLFEFIIKLGKEGQIRIGTLDGLQYSKPRSATRSC